MPIDPRDWYLLGCQVTPSSSVYINEVGTFGISSGSFYSSRVASALGRITQYLAGRFHFEHMAPIGCGRLPT